MTCFRPIIFVVVTVALGACSRSSVGASQPPAEPAAEGNTIASTGPAEPSEPASELESVSTPAPEIAADDPPTNKKPEVNPYVAPLVRTEGDLTVHAPPKVSTSSIKGRLRSHIEGALSKGSARVWVGPQVPGFVALTEGTMELFLMDRVHDDFMAVYRDPYGAGSCTLASSGNCHFVVRLYDIEGNEQWTVALHDLYSRPTHLEVQDVRYVDGMLFFNEACQSYSSEAGGKCSSLVAVDPSAGTVAWRTKPLVSNGEFLVVGDYIVSGYGFTAEPDFIYVVSRADGSVRQKLRVPKSPETFQINEDLQLEVSIYSSPTRRYQMVGWDTARPKLVRVKG